MLCDDRSLLEYIRLHASKGRVSEAIFLAYRECSTPCAVDKHIVVNGKTLLVCCNSREVAFVRFGEGAVAVPEAPLDMPACGVLARADSTASRPHTTVLVYKSSMVRDISIMWQ